MSKMKSIELIIFLNEECIVLVWLDSINESCLIKLCSIKRNNGHLTFAVQLINNRATWLASFEWLQIMSSCHRSFNSLASPLILEARITQIAWCSLARQVTCMNELRQRSSTWWSWLALGNQHLHNVKISGHFTSLSIRMQVSRQKN